ncbi:MAG: hypothetical protein OEV44_00430 [Spirochaetota bacterium]|nr:hypothetical protein [Spirochaetota bacterium]
MKKAIIIFTLIIIFIEPLSADLNDFFFTPQRRRFVFVEDYYNLYRRNLYGDTAAHLANIYYLKLALKAAETNQWWAHPTKSFAYVRYDWGNPPRNDRNEAPYTEKHHAKYKELMKMRICLLLTKSYLNLGSRYDKANIYWFNSEDYENLPYIKKKNPEHYIKRGLRIAKTCYTEALKYWEKTKQYVKVCWDDSYPKGDPKAKLFREIDLEGVEMDQMEDEVYKIYHQSDERYKRDIKDYYNKENYPEFNYDKVIKEKIEALKTKEQKLDEYISKLPNKK